MTDSLYAAYLCATHVGEQLLMIDDEVLEGRWTIRQVRHTLGIDTPKVIFTVADGQGHATTKCLDLPPRAILTIY